MVALNLPAAIVVSMLDWTLSTQLQVQPMVHMLTPQACKKYLKPTQSLQLLNNVVEVAWRFSGAFIQTQWLSVSAADNIATNPNKLCSKLVPRFCGRPSSVCLNQCVSRFITHLALPSHVHKHAPADSGSLVLHR